MLGLDDRRRAKKRRRRNIGFIEDYLVHSSPKDYRRLRLLVNGSIGVGLAVGMYYAALQNLNFGDFHPLFSVIIELFIIVCLTAAFATNIKFRCALMCIAIGAFGRAGQGPLTMMVISSLADGPVTNILENYHNLADNVICQFRIQAQLKANRIAMTVGPAEGFLQQKIKKAVKMGESLVAVLKSLMNPFLTLLKDEDTDEDEELENEAMAADILSGSASEDDDDMISQLRSSVAKRLAKRFLRICTSVFNKGTRSCYDQFAHVKSSCYAMDGLNGFLASIFICPRLDALELCEMGARERSAHENCRSLFEKMQLSSGFDERAVDLSNLKKDILEQLTLKVHFVANVRDRLEFVTNLHDLADEVQSDLATAMDVLLTAKTFFQALFLLFIYCIFREAVKTIAKYNNDIEFNNNVLRSAFWELDRCRERDGLDNLGGRLTKEEIEKLELITPFGPPTRDECKSSVRQFVKWIALAIVAGLVVFVDYYFHRLIKLVTSSVDGEWKQQGGRTVRLNVQGKGMIAELMRELVQFDWSKQLDVVISNRGCDQPPHEPDVDYNLKAIFLPLLLMLIIQVLFSFVTKRILTFHLLPFMFPRVAEARLLYLYNKVLAYHQYRDKLVARQDLL